MQDPILVKDPYNVIMAKVFQRVHPTKNRWLRRDLYPPLGLGTLPLTLALQKEFVGPVYEGLWINYLDYGGALWAKKGAGAAWSVGGATPTWSRTTGEKGNYSDFTVPDGHNRIHVMLNNSSSNGCSSVKFSWDDDSTDGIDVAGGGTTYNSKVDSYLVDLVVTTTTKPAGKNLRITHDGTDGTEYLRIIGVKSWDTTTEGDPSTNAGGVGTGHDMLTEFGVTNAASNKATEHDVISGLTDGTTEITDHGSNTSQLFAISWSPYTTALNPDNAAAVDKGDSTTVGIPCTSHVFDDGDKITISGCAGDGTVYNGSWTIASQTANEIVITTTFVAFTFAGTEEIIFAQRYSGADSHYGADQAEFKWAVGSNEETEGPEIFVDGASQGHLWNISDMTLRTLVTGTNIAANGKGFFDYNNDDTQDANDPTVDFVLGFSNNKMTLSLAVAWAADSYAPIVYCPMWVPSSPSTVVIKNIPDYESAAFVSYAENGVNEIVAYIPEVNTNVIISSGQTPDYAQVEWSVKLYMRAEANAMPGGDHPGSGDVLIVSGSWSVQDQQGVGADINGGLVS